MGMMVASTRVPGGQGALAEQARHAAALGMCVHTGTGFKDKAGEMSTSNIRALIQALPQYRDVLAKLSLHIQVSMLRISMTNHGRTSRADTPGWRACNCLLPLGRCSDAYAVSFKGTLSAR